MPRPISASISLSSLKHNLAVVAQQLISFSQQNRRVVPNIWAVIKANAYGHGIDNAVRAFGQAQGLAMLDLDEAVRCRELGWDKPILMLEGFFEPSDIRVFRDYSLWTTVHCQEQLDMLKAAAPGPGLNAMIKLNTGMSRLGFSPAAFAGAYRQALEEQSRGALCIVGKMTHFARSDDDARVTEAQFNLFMDVCRDLPGPVSLCNSAATLTPRYWLWAPPELEQWVRPGICLYGSTPFPGQSAEDLGLEPAMTLKSRIISVQEVPAGQGVGYGHVFVASQRMRVGVVACGYADGYPRHAPNGTPVTVDGRPTQLLGRVSMDMLIVDLTSLPNAGIGSPVVLWGQGGPSVDQVAHAAGTIGYELLCALAPRVPVDVS
ncbi:MAG TPA: alanine racemase [Pusillimonas sp.]|uniref:alanine racemase n=1 Tax=unclassified Pusillimonas TaxID=2640016 RepID=UPI0026208F7C|nr:MULTISPECIES: alanine racemase [unclassified Pusillimonas]HLU20098.1 alanine racemase [Pusillimonas sp.]